MGVAIEAAKKVFLKKRLTTTPTRIHFIHLIM